MNALKMIDMILVAVAFGLSTAFMVSAQQSVSLTKFLAIRTRVSDFMMFGFALFLCHTVFCICGLYRPITRAGRGSKIGDLLRATTLCTLCFFALSWVFSLHLITIQFLALFWVVSTMVMCTVRQGFDLLLSYVRIRSGNRHMLILGTNHRATEFARRVMASRERGYRLLGFADDDWPGMVEFEKTGFQVVTDYAGLPEFLRRNIVDEVAIYLPFATFHRQYLEVARLCEQHGIITR